MRASEHYAKALELLDERDFAAAAVHARLAEVVLHVEETIFSVTTLTELSDVKLEWRQALSGS